MMAVEHYSILYEFPFNFSTFVFLLFFTLIFRFYIKLMLHNTIVLHIQNMLGLVLSLLSASISLVFMVLYPPLTSTWPHLRCDVGLEEGEYRKKPSMCYSIVYCYNGAQRYKQFLQVGQLYRALILLGLALCLPSTSVSLVFIVLYTLWFKKTRQLWRTITTTQFSRF